MEALIPDYASSHVVSVFFMFGNLPLCLPILIICWEVCRIKALILSHVYRVLNVMLIRSIAYLYRRLFSFISYIYDGRQSLFVGRWLNSPVVFLDLLQEVHIVYTHHLGSVLESLP